MNSLPEVVIYQPYLAEYRKKFFVHLQEQLGLAGYHLNLITGHVNKLQKMRGDNISEFELSQIRELRLQVGSITYKYSNLIKYCKGKKLVVTELQSSHIDSLLLSILHPRKTILWGQASSKPGILGQVDAFLEKFMAKRVAHIFTYTDGGRNYLISRGILPGKITSLNNSTDTKSLSRQLTNLKDEDILKFKMKHRITERTKVAAYIGSIDSYKKIGFLIDAANEAAKRIPDFRLLVAGEGEQLEYLKNSIDCGIFLGHIGDHQKAIISNICVAIWNPGLVGLLAVDAMVLNKSILTLNNLEHGPEIEYIRSTPFLIETNEDTIDYVNTFISTYNLRTGLERPAILAHLSIESMVENFMKIIKNIA